MELADEVLDLGPGPVSSPRIRGWNLHSPPTNTARTAPYTMGFGERFNYIDAGIPRRQYAEKLAKHFSYDKADRGIYHRLKDLQPAAIRNAHKLKRHWTSFGVQRAEVNNPSTHVHRLVEFLNELADLGTD